LTARKYLTLHAPMYQGSTQAILDQVGARLNRMRVKWWIEMDNKRGIHVMIDVPEEYHRRAPTRKEMAHFQGLIDAGKADEALTFLNSGGYRGREPDD
jgi:hypothetical protein